MTTNKINNLNRQITPQLLLIYCIRKKNELAQKRFNFL